GLVEPGDRADADHAPLRVVRDDHEPSTGLDEGTIGLGLEQVRAGEPGVRVHAVYTHEHEINMDGAQRGHRERPHERLGWRALATGQDDRLVRATRELQDVGDPDRVGHHRQLGYLDQLLRERV